jgi:malonate transporter MadL subunit
MVIYGVALLAFSMLLGTYLGDLIGVMIGVQANVEGVSHSRAVAQAMI